MMPALLIERCLVALMALALIGGCSREPAPSGSSTLATSEKVPGHITMFAAASLADVLTDLKKDLAEKKVALLDLNLAASGTLAQQIENGAGADLFFSASVEWADALAKKDLVARRSDAFGNVLVLVVPADSQKPIHELKDLAGAEVSRVALADPKSAPAGKYARKALEALHLWEQVRPKVAAGDDVRQALLFVERGEADAALVYATDATGNKKVRVVAKIDETLAGPILYSLVLLKRGEQNPAAVETFKSILSPASSELFRRKGFQVLSEPGEQAQ